MVKKKKEKEEKKKKGIFKGKILKKPTAKLPSYNPEKMIMKGISNQALVREGRSKYFDEEYREEIKWL